MSNDARPPLRFIVQPPTKLDSQVALNEISTFLQDFRERSELRDDAGRAETSATLKTAQLSKLVSSLRREIGQTQGQSISEPSLSNNMRNRKPRATADDFNTRGSQHTRFPSSEEP